MIFGRRIHRTVVVRPGSARERDRTRLSFRPVLTSPRNLETMSDSARRTSSSSSQPGASERVATPGRLRLAAFRH